MWGFLAGVAAEASSGKSIVEQAAINPVGVTLFVFLISLASIIPKYASGEALAELHNAASREGLPQALRFFNKTHEIWVGRVAMMGITGLVVVEVLVKHGALF
jgi:hypothetical protein